MTPYLGLIRFKVTIEVKDHPKQEIKSEMLQLVMASDKEAARIALIDYFEKESNGATLIEARINDTIFGK